MRTITIIAVGTILALAIMSAWLSYNDLWTWVR